MEKLLNCLVLLDWSSVVTEVLLFLGCITVLLACCALLTVGSFFFYSKVLGLEEELSGYLAVVSMVLTLVFFATIVRHIEKCL